MCTFWLYPISTSDRGAGAVFRDLRLGVPQLLDYYLKNGHKGTRRDRD
jgi:hypothetical protein